MSKGVLVKDGIVIAAFEAASDYDPNYGGEGIAFIPDDSADVGDTWDGTKFTYTHIPESITALQGRIAINAAGLRTAVEAAVAAGNQDVKDMWQFSQNLHRNHPLLIQLASSIGLTNSDIDNLFLQASKIVT